MRTAITSLILLLTFAARSLAIDPQAAAAIPPLIAEGNEAQQRSDWTAADSAYRRALAVAVQLGDRQWQYRAWFYIGLVKQMAAEVAGDEAGKRALLEQSREPYRTALALNPKSKSTRINLAEAEWFLGDRETTVVLLGEALAIDGSFEIAEKLGDAYNELGNRAESARVYALAAERNSDSVTVHEKLLKVLLSGETPLGSALTGYLWELIQRKQIDRALDTAAQALGQTTLSAEDGRGARTMFATALARKDYDAVTFKGSAAAARMNALIAGRSPHGPALQVLVDAYRGAIDDQDAFKVWSDDAPTGPPASGFPSPMDAFRAVLRSIATTLSRLKHENAIGYYRLALAMDKAHVDPASVRGLASIYASQNRYQDLEKLDARYQQSMSVRASTPADAEDVYEYFRLMGRVETSHTPASPEGLERFEQAKAAGAGGVAEPELYEQLSKLYEQRGETGKSNGEKFSAATAYMERGNFKLARSALADLGHTQPDGVDQEAYRKMIQKLVWLPDSVRDTVPPREHFTVKRNVLLLCAGASKGDRDKALTELKSLGITVDTRQHDLYVRQPDGQLRRSHFFLPIAKSGIDAVASTIK